MNRKGLSPVIASVLLVALVLVLGMIVFLWAKLFIPDVIQKNGERIENLCPRVAFDASYFSSDDSTSDTLTIQNTGNEVIYGVNYAVEKVGSLEYTELTGKIVVAGMSKDYEIASNKATPGENIRLIPILLGEGRGGELEAFACEDAGITITA